MSATKPLRFCFGEEEIDIPHDFARYSQFVNDFLKYPSDDECIKMKLPVGFTVDQLKLVMDFLELFKENSEKKKPTEDKKRDKGADQLRDSADEGRVPALYADSNNKESSEETKNSAEEAKKARLVKLPEWALNFFGTVDKDRLFNAAKLGNMLGCREFVEHITFFIADKLRTMSVPKMRDYLNVTMDFEEGEFSLLDNEKSWHDLLVSAGVVPETKGV